MVTGPFGALIIPMVAPKKPETIERTAAPSNPGMSIGGWGLYLRPIDLVKFGQLYLQKGRWDDRQVVSESWIEASTRPHAVISDRTEYGCPLPSLRT